MDLGFVFLAEASVLILHARKRGLFPVHKSELLYELIVERYIEEHYRFWNGVTEKIDHARKMWYNVSFISRYWQCFFDLGISAKKSRISVFFHSEREI